MTKVANLLYMTQPSLTKRLQHMEEEFAVTIVDRTPKGLSFTKEGEYLAKQAREYLDFLEKTKATIRGMQESGEGEIIIGSSYTFSKFVLSDLLLAYRASHPHIQFNIINEQSDILFRRMLDESIDVGFIRGDYEGSVNRTCFGKDRAYLVTKEPTDLAALQDMQYIAYRTNDRTKEILNSWWEDVLGTGLPAGMVVGYVDVAWQLIAKGLGYTVCFLPASFENTYGLSLTPISYGNGEPVTRNTWFIYSKNKRISPMLEEFVTYIEQGIKERVCDEKHRLEDTDSPV